MEGYAEVQAFIERYLRDGPPEPPSTSTWDLDTVKLKAQEAADAYIWDDCYHYLQELWRRAYCPAQTASHLAQVHVHRCERDEAIAWFRKSLELDPTRQADHEMLLFLLDAHPTTTDWEALQERQRYFLTFGTEAYAKRKPLSVTRDPDRPLRIGYVSGDWNFHSAAFAFTSVVSAHTADYQAHVYCTLHPDHHDSLTREWKRLLGERFIECYGLSASQLAALIRHDEIDLLVDLAGYTSKNRLQTFMHRPAPIQIQAWGYVLGAGSPAIDVVFADAVTCPPSVQTNLTERVYHLPSILGYFPYDSMEGATELPCWTQPPVFAVFQRGSKINTENLAVWRRILEAVPASQIMFKGGDYTSSLKSLIVRALAGLEGRIIFAPPTKFQDHLNYYQKADLSLDPWPQTGGVSSLESLYMGVPMVTLLGDRMIQRTSASILTNVGFPDCIATTPDEYVTLAVRLVTTDRARLAEMRATARDRLLASPICAGYVQAVEAAYRQLWQEYCGDQRAVA